jgi:uncharacterized protein YjbI with pentapeptide repeats
MPNPRWAKRFRSCCVWLLTLFATNANAVGDIFRWDNGQVIPGTEGIYLGPGVKLPGRELEFARLGFVDLTGARFSAADLTNADFAGGNLTDTTFSDPLFGSATLAGA